MICAKEIATSIIQKYSNMDRDETCGRASDIIRDVSRVIEQLLREADRSNEHREAWLKLATTYTGKESFWERLWN